MTRKVFIRQEQTTIRRRDTLLVLSIVIQVHYRGQPPHKHMELGLPDCSHLGAPSLSRCSCILTVEENQRAAKNNLDKNISIIFSKIISIIFPKIILSFFISLKDYPSFIYG